MRQLRPMIREKGIWKTLRTSKDPSIVILFFEDSAALVGLVVAFLGIFLGQLWKTPVTDAIASIVIGLLLAAVASFLVAQSRRPAARREREPRDPGEHPRRSSAPTRPWPAPKDPLTMHLGPEEVLLNLEIDFHPGLPPGQITESINRLEQEIRRRHPEIQRIFIEARSLQGGETEGREPRRVGRGGRIGYIPEP